ncbi:MAG: hypothetical protein HZB16_15730 [Armatimonadetes bacterium]|nr:hypothetical protein [Armatimonadota bacterium]
MCDSWPMPDLCGERRVACWLIAVLIAGAGAARADDAVTWVAPSTTNADYVAAMGSAVSFEVRAPEDMENPTVEWSFEDDGTKKTGSSVKHTFEKVRPMGWAVGVTITCKAKPPLSDFRIIDVIGGSIEADGFVLHTYPNSTTEPSAPYASRHCTLLEAQPAGTAYAWTCSPDMMLTQIGAEAIVGGRAPSADKVSGWVQLTLSLTGTTNTGSWTTRLPGWSVRAPNDFVSVSPHVVDSAHQGDGAGFQSLQFYSLHDQLQDGMEGVPFYERFGQESPSTTWKPFTPGPLRNTASQGRVADQIEAWGQLQPPSMPPSQPLGNVLVRTVPQVWRAGGTQFPDGVVVGDFIIFEYQDHARVRPMTME